MFAYETPSFVDRELILLLRKCTMQVKAHIEAIHNGFSLLHQLMCHYPRLTGEIRPVNRGIDRAFLYRSRVLDIFDIRMNGSISAGYKPHTQALIHFLPLELAQIFLGCSLWRINVCKRFPLELVQMLIFWLDPLEHKRVGTQTKLRLGHTL